MGKQGFSRYDLQQQRAAVEAGRRSLQSDMERYHQKQTAAHLNARNDEIREGFSLAWLLAVGLILIVAAFIIISFPPMSEGEARQAAKEYTGGIASSMPEDTKVCILQGECYSWGMKAEPWHKFLLLPLGLFAVCWVLAIFRKLRYG